MLHYPCAHLFLTIVIGENMQTDLRLTAQVIMNEIHKKIHFVSIYLRGVLQKIVQGHNKR